MERPTDLDQKIHVPSLPLRSVPRPIIGGSLDVYVSIDMEGIAGLATSEQCRPGSDAYPVAQRLMTQEANAAIQGSFEGGATRVLVNDSHAGATNLLQEELDERAELLNGSPKVPFSMMQGISDQFDVIFFIGYHAGAGTSHAVRAHTCSGACFYDVRLNGTSVSEAELNANLAATFGVPLGLLTGDDAVCEFAEKRFPGVHTVRVKEAMGVSSASSLHPERARAAIREAATAVVAGVDAFVATLDPGPYTLEVDMAFLEMAEACALIPGTERSGRTVRFTSDDFSEVFRCVDAFIYVGEATNIR